ncbi:cytochrome c biogenesis CcdA family protein [Caminibacter pacificus]|uniref:Cytochrome C biogenesis protein n=1 Tax=Caminibacter pacificus TaxID=1424653 RepID=A0AAJ4RDD7_9BACT|nr:cytochrome c biogenesis protein CcdA [Caminibacter pacificus]NPA87162.1 cytochrome C biogenesis protein [Campylobacterota bacterium]QCI28676.1 cytochrome C biogenesis protein [Caminibacter pacificus]ROR40593.1 cytochrome c-type biogenesis protein [Caminibacter pacificus]
MFENLSYSLFDYFDKMPFVVSYIAGLLSFLSPCVLPLVPIYFFYITGISAKELQERELNKKEKIKIFLNSMLFIAGFGVVFILLGAAAANLIGNIFANKWVNIIAGIVIVLFGLNVGGFIKFKFLQFEKRANFQNAGSFLLGVSFALGWTPCIGPIFGTIVGIAATEPAKSVFMMILYTLGLATPFILMAFFTVASLKLIEKTKKYMGIIEKISGLLLIAVGIYIFYKGIS